MSHTYVSCLLHCVWSTKNRQPLLTPQIATRLYPYMGGIAKENGFHILASGGVADHVHSIFSLPSTLAIAKAVQLVKGGASKWIHEEFGVEFEWQEGYGAFTVSASQRESVREYIGQQDEHHRKRSFQEEYLDFLQRCGVSYDERYLW